MNGQQMMDAIAAGAFDTTFQKLYGAQPARIVQQRQRYIDTIQRFEKTYGAGRSLSLYSTPGRTEIGGNHTDHNNGIVMAASIDLDIIAVVAKNGDNVARVTSFGFPETDEADLTDLAMNEKEFGKSLALLRGVAAGIIKQGGSVGGFDAYTTSDVLKGSGLSSSAAFEVCLGSILNGEYNDGRFTPIELGIIGQYAENEYFGKPSGLMDQLACAVGGAITIDFKTPGQPVVGKAPVSLDDFGYALVITDTKGDHADLTDDYAAIRREMESVATYFGKSVLRDVDRETFFADIRGARQKVGVRPVLRAIHFFEECRRVGVLADALKAKDFDVFKKIIIESGHSSFELNQNAYSPKQPQQQEIPLALALSQIVLAGQGAWRLQGGGFAGTIQAFVPHGLINEYKQVLGQMFDEDACHVLTIRSVGCTPVQP